MEETLTCGICQSVFYKPVSCIPCLHTFCAPCYSEWMERKPECPQCRTPVTEVRRNHALLALTDTFLMLNPSKKRKEDEIAELEKRNKITDESLRIAGRTGKKRPRDESESEHYEDEEDEEDYIGSEDDGECYTAPKFSWGGAPAPHIIGPPGGFGGFGFGFGFPVPDTCSACDTPDIHGYQCPKPPSHQICVMCHLPFPLRKDIDIPTRCSTCMKSFCQLYRGCRAPAAVGCLGKLKDHKMDMFPDSSLGGNKIELKILIDHTRFKGLKGQQIWQTCLSELEKKHWKPEGIRVMGPPFHTSGSGGSSSSTIAAPAPVVVPVCEPDTKPESEKPQEAPVAETSVAEASTSVTATDPVAAVPLVVTTPTSDELTTDTIVCRRCASDIFGRLLYHYRGTLPVSELPAAVSSRPNCWFGRTCRTQNHNLGHAQKFNHICDASR
eukprot:TRINITY_DN16145_c0_g1_i2.p1 TRINITY_DN16145_c0_g1~~TRINITY_DN16145_c0_g1_i2.p1  ORF type:complete len:440 (+),score=47.83 TRINITY_DN16145_c0_g1_i2:539-1858(+)